MFGLAPAWQASRTDLVSALRDGGRTGNAGARARGRNALVGGEVALALVLLVGASLFVRSFLNLQHANRVSRRAADDAARLHARQRYAGRGTKGRRVDDMLARVERLPGVQAAAASNLIPLDGGGRRGAGGRRRRGADERAGAAGASPA